MKAYKYERYVQGWHWSASISETIFYIPGAEFIIYKHNDKFGINKEDAFVNEAKEYIFEVQSGKIEKDYAGSFVNKNCKFVKEVAERKEERDGKKITHMPFAMVDFEEVDINITEEGIADLMVDNQLFEQKKEAFKKTEEQFYNNLKNLILEK